MLPTDKELLSNLSENRHRSAKKKKKWAGRRDMQCLFNKLKTSLPALKLL